MILGFSDPVMCALLLLCFVIQQDTLVIFLFHWKELVLQQLLTKK